MAAATATTALNAGPAACSAGRTFRAVVSQALSASRLGYACTVRATKHAETSVVAALLGARAHEMDAVTSGPHQELPGAQHQAA